MFGCSVKEGTRYLDRSFLDGALSHWDADEVALHFA